MTALLALATALTVGSAPSVGAEEHEAEQAEAAEAARAGEVAELERAWTRLLEARPGLLGAAAEAQGLETAAVRRATDAHQDLAWIAAERDAARLGLAVATEARDRAAAARQDARARLDGAQQALRRSRDRLGSHAATIYKHGPPAIGAVEVLLRSGSPTDYVIRHRLSQAVLNDDGAAVDRDLAVHDRLEDAHRRAVAEHRLAEEAREVAAEAVQGLERVADEQRGHLNDARGGSARRQGDSARARGAVADNAAALVRLEDRIRELGDDRHRTLAERRLAADGRAQAQIGDDHPYLGRRGGRARPAEMPPVAGYACPVPGSDFTNDWAFPRPGGRSHEGTDLFAPRHTPTLAVAAGEVVEVDRHDRYHGGAVSGDLGGRTVTVRTPSGERWYYAHLEEVADGIAVGASVEAGQVVGTLGDSGNARGGAVHLHLGRTWRGVAINPWPSLALACEGD